MSQSRRRGNSITSEDFANWAYLLPLIDKANSSDNSGNSSVDQVQVNRACRACCDGKLECDRKWPCKVCSTAKKVCEYDQMGALIKRKPLLRQVEWLNITSGPSNTLKGSPQQAESSNVSFPTEHYNYDRRGHWLQRRKEGQWIDYRSQCFACIVEHDLCDGALPTCRACREKKRRCIYYGEDDGSTFFAQHRGRLAPSTMSISDHQGGEVKGNGPGNEKRKDGTLPTTTSQEVLEAQHSQAWLK